MLATLQKQLGFAENLFQSSFSGLFGTVRLNLEEMLDASPVLRTSSSFMLPPSMCHDRALQNAPLLVCQQGAAFHPIQSNLAFKI
jgi:hypothetical protein